MTQGAVVGLAVMLAGGVGCLSDPDAASRADAADHGADAAVGRGDADPGADAMPAGPGTAFPPVGTEVNIEAGAVADVNGDGVDDLLLASRTGFASSNGVYVLLGQAGVGVPDFHEFFGTGAHEPLAVGAGAIGAANGLDVVALVVDYGDPKVEFDNETIVQAYARGADGRFDATPFTRDIGVGDGCPLPRFEDKRGAIAVGRFVPGADLPAVAVGHDHGVCVVQAEAFSALAWQMAGRTAVGPDYIVSELLPVPSDMSGLDDLLAPSELAGRWYRNDGAGGFVTAEQATAGGMRRAAFVDLDGNDPVDMIGIRQVGLIAHVVATPGNDVALPFRGDQNLSGFPGGLSHVAVVEADDGGDARPDVLLASGGCDGADPTGAPCVAMFRNVYADGAALETDVATEVRSYPASFRPAHLFVGDFDGDDIEDILVFSVDGRAECLRATGGKLQPCD